MGGFEELVVWQRSVSLSVDIYQTTQNMRDYGFRDQITRAGLSIPSNIAEGMERTSQADRIRFLDYALGSCGEVRTQALIGLRVGFFSSEVYQRWSSETREIAAMLKGLARSIKHANLN